MRNKEIRTALFENEIRAYEVAHKLGMRESNFSGLLSRELSEVRRKQILDAISEIIAERGIGE